MKLTDRILFTILLIIDHLFKTDLVDREINRRKRRIASLNERLDLIEREMRRLERLMQATNIQLCVLYLRERRLRSPETWLTFDPANENDEYELNLMIEHLVKTRLATIDMETLAPEHYRYHLHPDWEAIEEALAELKP